MATLVVPLTDSKVKQAKPDAKAYKLADGGGLYLYVTKSGVKSWRFDYRQPVTKKRLTMTLGQYPDVTLAQARAKRSDIRAALANSIDPQQQRLDNERDQALMHNSTFDAVAAEYISRKTHVSAATITNNKLQLKQLSRFIGSKPIASIKPVDVLDACRSVESKGNLETAKKMRIIAGQVFRYGVQTDRCERDITQDLKGALKTPITRHHATIIDSTELGHLLRAIDSYNGSFEVCTALKLMPMLFVRSGELRHALWHDFDLDAATWTFTPRKTKRITGVSLIVPLPDQAVDLIRALMAHRRSVYLFPAIHTKVKPMSENTLNQALKRLGYSSSDQTIHGFRATARTLIVERLKYPEQLVEMQLGHKVRDMHGRAYNRTTMLDERRKMMQSWCDYLDTLKKG